MQTYISLDVFDLALAAVLLIVNAGLSLALSLKLERQILIAATRMVVQLYLVGLVLKGLFAVTSPWLVLLVALLMFCFAGYEIGARQQRPLAGLWSYGLGGGAMVLSCGIVTLLALTAVVGPQPWYAPRYAIPLFGMILGNTMTGVSLGYNTLTTTAYRDRSAIEAQLALGANRWKALRPSAHAAIVSGLMPTLNAMAATGVVFLPGMMTGQILAGVEPEQAVRYQLLIMFLIAGSSGAGVFLAVYLAIWRLTDDRSRLRLDRLASGG
jgi:putative ABC transport system permease protein